ncbi:MAG: carbon-nitrogen hydrolase family protein [Myxococcaceae bacterium]|nr:carbon-nitrogen hydrolase family protein [Myxococcaceae bacterium]
MRVTVLELPARPGAVEAQLRLVEEELSRSPPGELVLLSEAILTGYLPDPSPLAERRGGPTEQALASLSQRFRTHVVGPLIERDGAQVFNAVTAPGLFHYRKRNPWYVETWAAPGLEPAPVVTVAGRRVTVCICFDVHFLENVDADVLLFPSAWVDDAPVDSRGALLPEVAQRFGVTVVNANWGVGEPRVRGQGGSRVVAASGEVLGQMAAGARRLDVEL